MAWIRGRGWTGREIAQRKGGYFFQKPFPPNTLPLPSPPPHHSPGCFDLAASCSGIHVPWQIEEQSNGRPFSGHKSLAVVLLPRKDNTRASLTFAGSASRSQSDSEAG